MSIKKDLAKIAVQEERLQFQDFDADTAWKLGNRLTLCCDGSDKLWHLGIATVSIPFRADAVL